MPHERQEIDDELLQRATGILRAGGLVAYPTDTVYGLAADPTNASALDKLSEAKKRDPSQPVPHLIANTEMAASVAAGVPPLAGDRMQAFWPGGLTIILHKAQSAASTASASAGTIGLRVPNHAVPRALSRLLGGPITGTSANITGGPEPLWADDVRRVLGDAVDLIIDGGRCRGDRPSTVIDCTRDPPRILRAGAVSVQEIERALGRKVAMDD